MPAAATFGAAWPNALACYYWVQGPVTGR